MKLNPYLNFDGTCEEAFKLYKKVFGGEFAGNGIMRFGDIPPQEGMTMPDEIKNRVMHVGINIGDQVLMGSDIMPGMKNNEGGENFRIGDNSIISIHPDSREEADRIFNELSAGGKVESPMADQFWGDYWGSLIDRFGSAWMINYNPNEQSTF
ncbi:VOC family protein [uncultured Chryseobacterium sp.]|uniref:VOC family protein n=1 Tax=uncultured Chryseobacterium sp. TaxID=259322 RepID=UPI00261B9BD0|nr:VOC family protein [uncultured Chryseobacterium sp.]